MAKAPTINLELQRVYASLTIIKDVFAEKLNASDRSQVELLVAQAEAALDLISSIANDIRRNAQAAIDQL